MIPNLPTNPLLNLEGISLSIKKGPPSITFNVGELLKGEVVSVESAKVARINIKGVTLEVKTTSALQKGESLLLKVEKGSDGGATTRASDAGGGTVKLRIVSSESHETRAVTSALTRALSTLSGDKLTSREITSFKEVVAKIDPAVIKKLPELKAVADMMKPVAGLTGRDIKETVKSSGLFLESKIAKKLTPGKILAEKKTLSEKIMGLKSSPRQLRALIGKLVKSDMKASLIRINEALKETAIIDQLTKGGVTKPTELASTVEKMINNIELFQVQSKLTEGIDLFFPFFWQALKDGEMLFSESCKGGKGKNKSYSCTINLDLEATGRLSTIILLMYDSIHVSFTSEKSSVVELINDNVDALKTRFLELHIPVGSIKAELDKNIDFKVIKKTVTEGFSTTI